MLASRDMHVAPCSVDGRRRCLFKCFVSNMACFPLSGSIQSRRCSISRVSGRDSRPRLPLKLETSELAPDLTILMMRLLPHPSDFLFCSLSISSLFACFTVHARLRAAGPLCAPHFLYFRPAEGEVGGRCYLAYLRVGWSALCGVGELCLRYCLLVPEIS